MKNSFKYLTILLLIFCGHVFACDCKPEKTVKDEIKWADIVIHGKVIKVTVDTILNKNGDLDNRVPINEYEILIIKKYKGRIDVSTIIIRTEVDPSSSCGLILKVGEELIFYARNITEVSHFLDKKEKHIYWTSNCTRTRFFNQIEQSEIEKEI